MIGPYLKYLSFYNIFIVAWSCSTLIFHAQIYFLLLVIINILFVNEIKSHTFLRRLFRLNYCLFLNSIEASIATGVARSLTL